ncbi:MAG: PAS domain-containing protein [Clostridia bacterium]|nr:PAS domain-containing protein [Clostridia bacterium]
MFFSLDAILLFIALIIVIGMLIFLLKAKKKNQLHKVFIILFSLLFVWFIGLLLQIYLSTPLKISPIYFEYLIYISACFLPVFVLIMSLIFVNTKIKFTTKYLFLFVIPLTSLFILWTNDFHHLFYEQYSTNFRETIFGPYFLIHSIYSYSCIAIGIIYLLYYTIRNSGFFSRQSLLICIGALISLLTSIVSTFGILDLSIYITPISFTLEIFLISLAMFKFNFLTVAPIALQKVVDRISDAYIVINENNTITDFNQTFLNMFEATSTDIRNKNLFDLLSSYKELNININIFSKSLKEVENSNKTVILEKHFDKINKYFHIEINRIESKGNFLGTLILLKDITQHTVDMQTIKDNQDMLVEKERLASLGQMIGGIAHNLKTPIMSIAGAAEGLSDLIKEYDSSVEDSDVTAEDHHEIAKEMQEWIEKTKTHLSYMSDVITAIKGQAVAFSEQTASGFTVRELINYVDILMKHELKNALINLKTQANIDTSTVVNGNINSLVQVINNIISNSIQAYQAKGKTNEDINFTIYKEGKNIIFKIEDFAGGLPAKVQDKLFKEMVTTKGKNGTGLGLFMSYSNIKAHFSGNIKYETQKGKGTSFFVEIPLE